MSVRRLVSLTALTAIGALGLSSVAQAAPVWNLDLHHNQTHFAPGGTGEYWVAADNVGDADTSGPISVKITLPAGITRNSVRLATVEDKGAFYNYGAAVWSCPGSPGDKSLTCTTSSKIARHSLSRDLFITVDVAPGLAIGKKFASAKIEGGGAVKAASAVEPTEIDPTPAGFGILPETFTPDFLAADGLSVERQAGAHPDLFSTSFDFNSVDAPNVNNPVKKEASEAVRHVVVDTPAGFVGAPTAVGECKQAEFTLGECPASSQVGRFEADLRGFLPVESANALSTGVYNLSHPRGTVSDLAFAIAGNPVHIRVSLDPARNYAIRSIVPDANESLPPLDQHLTLWGVPADHSHDSERCQVFSTPGPYGGGNTKNECSTDLEPKPFLTLPAQCEADSVMSLHDYDSWQQSGVFGPRIDYTLPGKMTGCDRLRFDPDVEIEPTGKQANTPTGLDVHVKVAQNENPNALSTPPVKRIAVTLPDGMSFSPSFADGLQSCTLAQMELGNNDPVRCPDASRIGEVALSTPLLPKPAEGSMFLAAQRDNPFGSTFALLLAIHDTEERGALIKIPGKIEVDQQTGRITTIFNDTPQFPFEDMTLKFRSGPRAPLVSPPSCGTQKIDVQVTSYAQPNNPIDASNTYQVTEGPNGTACPPDSAKRPFAPRMDAGTLNPSAGAYSPFVFRMRRDDQEQELSQVTTTLPPGLLAKISGISYCSEAAIASISTAEGAGHRELANPACPAASKIGSISAGLGAGSAPNYFPGTIYLAGPYKGAPLSFAVVAPGIAGPFDLGNVVVRVALYVNSETAQVKAVSDPFPTILHGLLLRVRDIRIRTDRPETTINPTNCDPMSVNGLVTGVGGSLLTTADDSLFSAATPFQVGNCASLGFKPKLFFKLKGGTHRGDFPALQATLIGRPGDANIASTVVSLPRSEFLEQSHIGTVCTRVQFAADQCPARSIYGKATATSPLFDETLEGPVYLRSSSHALPDLVVSLNGKIDVALAGRVDTVHGGIRNSFEVVPDAPVTKFTLSMQGGKKSLLVNSRNLCLRPAKAEAQFVAQNGKTQTMRPKMQTACGGGEGRKGKRVTR